MTQYKVGGRRRIDRVLAPGYAENLGQVDLDELRARKAEADQEETDLSYARRLLQGRIDLLCAEREARANGEPSLIGRPQGQSTDEELAQRLSRILADGAQRPQPVGMGRFLQHEPSRVGENRREAERAVADLTASDLGHLSQNELGGALEHLQDVERRISAARKQVQAVADALTAEIARRYQLGEVPITLPS